MGRVVAQQIVTVDGFAADEQGELGFFGDGTDWAEVDRRTHAWLGGVERILLGANTYRLFVEYWPTAGELLAEPINTTPKTVFSSTLSEAPCGEWRPAEVERGDPVQAVRRMTTSSSEDMVVWGSLTLFRALLAAELIDELELRVMPIVLAAGTPLFTEPARLALRGVESYEGGVLLTRYHPLSSDSTDIMCIIGAGPGAREGAWLLPPLSPSRAPGVWTAGRGAE
ncbi:dihydrofolate reductase family protein [Naasia sp. SYSU D00948]|uniref:dihydrofolate reductase family protein n=1 Tax=Naasia sp. SYSU D00948 TaxID=2817379 RepID=UPI001B3164C4|nr:dihydrofolate reductase family protein [Naasia sp. SYSU D00948]